MKMKTTTLRIVTFTVIVFAFFSGCKKNEDPTTYQIINNCPFYNYEYFNGTLYDIIVYHYVGTEKVDQGNIASLSSSGGKSKIVEVGSNCDKIRFSFKFISPSSSLYSTSKNARYYIVASKKIVRGKNNIVTLTGNTMITTSPYIQGEETFFSLGDTDKFIRF